MHILIKKLIFCKYILIIGMSTNLVVRAMCTFCKKVIENNRKKCSRCKRVYYCDETCQKNHWLEHKKKCVPVEERKSAILRDREVKHIMTQVLGQQEIQQTAKQIRAGGITSDPKYASGNTGKVNFMIVVVCSINSEYNVGGTICIVQPWKFFLKNCEKGSMTVDMPEVFVMITKHREITVHLPIESQEQMMKVRDNTGMIPVIIIALLASGNPYPIFCGMN